MTAFFGVHLVLTVVSLTLGTIIGVPDECQAAIRGLLPRCDSDTSTGLARDQRMQRTLDRIVTGHGQVGS